MLPENLEIPADFRPRAPWLGGDLQTLKAFLDKRRPDLSAWPARRLWLPLQDGSGDRLAARLQEPEEARGPLVVLLHGLTGCEDSAYVMESAAAHLQAGRRVVSLNLRGAGPSRPHCRQAYHAGRSGDLALALSALESLEPGLCRQGFFLQGYSLGANMLLKFLAEYGADFPLMGAVSVSAPIDLKASQVCLMRPRNRLYHDHMLKQMRREALGGPGLSREEERLVRSVRDVWEFDENLTAPRNGFAGADDYYARNAALQFLARIEVPTLVIHACDDPWIPAAPYLAFDWRRAPYLRPLLPATGGHVGFHGRGSRQRWHDRCSLAFLAGLEGRAP